MMSRVLKLGLCVATLAALWCTTPEAQAQRRGRGGRSTTGVYVGPGGVGVDVGRDGSYRDGSYRDGYYRDGYSRGGYWYGGRWFGPNRGYWYNSYPLYTEDYGAAPVQTYQSFYPAEEPLNNARIHVRVPAADAEVWFNDSATQQRGMDRIFETPALTSGATYSYEVKARWRDQNGQMTERTQTVRLRQGRESMVDFTRTRAAGGQERIPPAPTKQERKQLDQNRPDQIPPG